MSGKPQKRPTFLAPECELGRLALTHWRRMGRREPTHMRLTGDGCIAFGWRENLPAHTQEAHFVDDDGGKYDCGENSVPILGIIREARAESPENAARDAVVEAARVLLEELTGPKKPPASPWARAFVSAMRAWAERRDGDTLTDPAARGIVAALRALAQPPASQESKP
jgi:hypothetical protein